MEKFYRLPALAGRVNENGAITILGSDEFGENVEIHYIHLFIRQEDAYKFLADLCTNPEYVPSYDREGYEGIMENWTFDINEVYERYGMEASA